MATNPKCAFTRRRLRIILPILRRGCRGRACEDRRSRVVRSYLTSLRGVRWRDATCAAYRLVEHDVGDI
jgi:hypothetical protein